MECNPKRGGRTRKDTTALENVRLNTDCRTIGYALERTTDAQSWSVGTNCVLDKWCPFIPVTGRMRDLVCPRARSLKGRDTDREKEIERELSYSHSLVVPFWDRSLGLKLSLICPVSFHWHEVEPPIMLPICNMWTLPLRSGQEYAAPLNRYTSNPRNYIHKQSSRK